MKIDILTRRTFERYEESVRIYLKFLTNELNKLNQRIIELNDRIKILESK